MSRPAQRTRLSIPRGVTNIPRSSSQSENAEASMTVGTPTAITGTPRFSADSISLLLPTPEPGAMPLLHT